MTISSRRPRDLPKQTNGQLPAGHSSLSCSVGIVNAATSGGSVGRRPSSVVEVHARRLTARPFECLREWSEKLSEGCVQCTGDLDERANVDIAFTTLDIADRVAVKAGAFSQGFLGEAETEAKLTNTASDRRRDVTRHGPYLSGCTTGCLHNTLCISNAAR